MSSNQGKITVSNAGGGEYRLTFPKPLEYTTELFFLVGSHNIKSVCDADYKLLFGLQGEKEVLLSWVSSLNGISAQALNELEAAMTD